MSNYTKYHKEYYKKNKDKILDKLKLKRRTPEGKEAKRKAEQKYASKNPKVKLYHIAKHRAIKKGLEFTITKDDITIPTHCPILGITLDPITGIGRKQNGCSLDRIDSTKGYTPDNIWVISDLANRMKAEATKEQLLAFATGVIKIYA